MGLISDLKVKPNAFHLARLKLIDGFDYTPAMDKVDRDFNGALAEDQLIRGIENLKRYYAVVLFDPRNLHAVSAVVDPFWHAHVLLTREYAKFCDEILGTLVHHIPLDPKDKPMVKYVTKLYDYTVQTYPKIFKAVDDNVWPESSHPRFKAVCLHYCIITPEVRANALFPRHRDIMDRGAPKSISQHFFKGVDPPIRTDAKE
jgi:hypothetical protein